MLQDRVGYLWAGTDDGLFRFDGRQFTKFSREQGLPRTRIYQLFETADGRFYAATGGRAHAADRRPLRRHRRAGRVSGPFAISHEGLAADAAGTVYVGTDRGLYSGKNDHYEYDKEANALGDGPVGAVHVDAAGALYYARGGRLYRKESGRAVEFGRPRGLPTDETIDDVRDRRRRAGSGCARSSTSTCCPRGGQRFERDDDGLPESSEVGRLAFDDRGRAARPDGARPRLLGERRLAADRPARGARFRRGALRARGSRGLSVGRAARRRARPPPRARRVHELDALGRALAGGRLGDRPPEDEGRAAARSGSGPSRGSTASIRSPATSGATTSATASAATRSTRSPRGEDGSLWIGSWPGGVTRFLPDGKVRHYAPPDIPPEQFRVAAIHVRPDGEVWVGAVEGVYPPAGGLVVATVLERVRVGGDTAGRRPRVRRGPVRNPLRREPAGNPPPDRGVAALLHDARRPARGLPVVDRVRRRRQRRRRVPRIDRRGEGHRSTATASRCKPMTTATGLVSNKVVLIGRDAVGLDLDRHRHRRRRVRPRLGRTPPATASPTG